VNKREFITLLGGGAAAWPLAARAQQTAMPVIGYLSARSRENTSHLIAAFQRGLAESDYVDGRNVTIEYRVALGQMAELGQRIDRLQRQTFALDADTTGLPAEVVLGVKVSRERIAEERVQRVERRQRAAVE
jgi:putative tryptophan/tyrosine transport system substrate-binding protein